MIEHISRFLEHNTFLTFSCKEGLAYQTINRVERKLAVGCNKFRVDYPSSIDEQEQLCPGLSVM